MKQITNEQAAIFEALLIQNRDSSKLQKASNCSYLESINLLNELRTPVNEGQPVQVEGFTPGEWYIVIDRETPGLTKYFFDRDGDETEEEAKANAVLIASAPTLLKENEALKDLLKWIVNEVETTPNELNDALLGLIKIRCNKALSQTETK